MIVRDCGAHGKFPSVKNHFEKVLGENRLKNQALTKLTRGISDLVPDWDWYFDKNRVLHLRSSKLTMAEEKGLAQRECNLIAGPGKVVIE
jgi:hypothetical protein